MWKRIAALTLIGLFSLVAFLHTGFFERWVLGKIESYASRAGFRLSAANLHYTLWNLRFRFDDLAAEKDGNQIRARRIRIDIPWRALWSDAVEISSLDLEGASIHIRQEPTASTQAGFVKAPRLRIGRVSVRNSSFSFNRENTFIEVPQFAMDIAGGHGTLHIKSQVRIHPDGTLEVHDIPIILSEDGLSFGPTAWRAQYASIAGHGSTQGKFLWLPDVSARVSADWFTDPTTLLQWKDVRTSGKLSLEDGKLGITEFRAVLGNGNVTGKAEISSAGNRADLAWASVRLDLAGSPVTAEGALDFRWSKWDFSDASGQGRMTLANPRYGRARSPVRIIGPRAEFDISAEAFDTTLRADITAGLDEKLAGTFLAQHRQFGKTAVKGTIGGTFRDPQVDATIDIREARFNHIGPINATGRAVLASHQLSLSGIEATYRDSSMRGQMKLDLDSQRLEGKVQETRVQVQDFFPHVKGGSSITATIGGTLEKPKIEFEGSSDGLDIGPIHVEHVDLEGRLDEKQVILNRLEARRGQQRMQALGTLNLATEEISGELAVSDFKVSEVDNLSAAVSLEAKVRGNYKSPRAQFSGQIGDLIYRREPLGNVTIQGTVDGETASARVMSQRLSATATVDLKLSTPFPFTATIAASRSRLHYRAYDAVIDGVVDAAGQIEPFRIENIMTQNLTATARGLKLVLKGSLADGMGADLSANLAQIPVEDVHLGGQVQVKAVVRGKVQDPHVEGELETDNLTIQAKGMDEPAAIDARLTFTRDDVLIRKLQAQWAGATATVSGQGKLAGTGRLTFQIDNIRPERILKENAITGLMGLEGNLEIQRPDLDGIRAESRFTTLQLNAEGVPIRQSKQAEMGLSGQTLVIHNLSLEGARTRADIDGTLDLRRRRMDININGTADLGILKALIPDSASSGSAAVSISIAGTPEKPEMAGVILVAGMQLRMANPPIIITDGSAELRLRGDRLEIVAADGNINGGDFTAKGDMGISVDGIRQARLELRVQNAQLEYPPGFESDLSSQLKLTGSSGDLLLSGRVNVNQGSYRKNIGLTREVFTAMTAEARMRGLNKPGISESTRLDLEASVPGEVIVSNNLAHLRLVGSFRVRGTAADPIITGRASALEGGELYFGPRRGDTVERRDAYVLEAGSIDFSNPIRTEPHLNFVARREVAAHGEKYVITLRASGTLNNLRTDLSSDPPLPESDIVALLITGRTLDEASGAQLAIAREQVTDYASGQLSSFFEKKAAPALGLNTVRIDPILVATEEDLGARLTIGKDITRDFNLIYSQNLAEARAQTWIATYAAFRNFLLRGVNDSNNSIKVELRHELRFGGTPTLAGRLEEQRNLIIDSISFEGTTIPKDTLLDRVAKPGSRFNSFKLQDDLRKLESFFTSRDFLDVNIRPQRSVRDGRVHMTYHIQPGAKITIEYQGATVPEDVRKDIRQLWASGFFEQQKFRNIEQRLLRYFRDQGYLTVEVQPAEREDGEARHLIFTIVPGSRYPKPSWVFQGGSPMPINESIGTVLQDPETIRSRIEDEYRRQGYLDVSVKGPALKLLEGKAEIHVNIEKGPQYRVSAVSFAGNQFFGDEELRTAVLSQTPQTFTADWLETARQSLIARYWKEGFNDFRVSPAVDQNKEDGTAVMKFEIEEGSRQIIKQVKIEGNRTTDTSFIRRFFAFKASDPVDYERINLTRKRLYDTGLFLQVEVKIEPADDGYVALTQLTERPQWRLRYGLAVTNHLQTSDRELGLATDFWNSNVGGRGMLVGASFTYNARERQVRAFGSRPLFLGKEIKTDFSVSRTRDLSIPGSITDIWGVTIQQQLRLFSSFILSYNYNYKRNHTFTKNFDPKDPFAFNITIPIARFNAALTRDTRDDILDSTRGSFLSNSFEIAPPDVGSSITFFRNYTQYFMFRPLRGMTWATGLRAGFASGFRGQELIPTERFRAGGATTVRGFKQDELSRRPGNSLFIVNQELRFPIAWILKGAAFFDAGNVYPSVSDFNPFDLRPAAGLGLRVQTPFVLLRFDFGFNLQRRRGEDRLRFGFGIGQAY